MLRLNLWKSNTVSVADRIYVNGFHLPGKVWVSKNKAGELIMSIEGLSPANALNHLPEFLKELSIDLLSTDPWAQLLAQCNSPSLERQQSGMVNHAIRTGRPISGANVAHARRSVPGSHGMVVGSIPVPDQIQIRCDHREPASLVASLREAINTTVTLESLPLADFILNDRIYVERKTVRDFELSIINEDKRLFNQVEQLSIVDNATVIVLVEGDLFGSAISMSPEQISGALSYLAAIKGVAVMHTLDEVHTAYMLVKMATHDKSGLGYHLSLRAKKPDNLISVQRFVLEGIPGVSGGMSDLLLAHFGTIAAVATATREQLLAVKGVGPKLADSVVQVMQGDQTLKPLRPATRKALR